MADDLPSGELTDEQRYGAAAGDMNLLAYLMVAGSTIFAVVNLVLGSFGWIAALVAVSSTAVTASGLLNRIEGVVAVTKVGFGISGLAAPVFGIAGLVLGLFGVSWGWALLAGAVLYFAFSVLGLEIIERAENAGVVGSFEEP